MEDLQSILASAANKPKETDKPWRTPISELPEDERKQLLDDEDDESDTVDGRLTVELDDDAQDLVDEVTAERHESYKNGNTKDTNFGDSEAKMRQGVLAEVAVTMAYDEAELDRRVSASGDDGFDVSVELNGELRDVDVKSVSWRNGKLRVRQDRAHDGADAFLLTHVPENMETCELIGWVSKNELCVPENTKESKYGFYNWELSQSELDDIPIPNSENIHI